MLSEVQVEVAHLSRPNVSRLCGKLKCIMLKCIDAFLLVARQGMNYQISFSPPFKGTPRNLHTFERMLLITFKSGTSSWWTSKMLGDSVNLLMTHFQNYSTSPILSSTTDAFDAIDNWLLSMKLEQWRTFVICYYNESINRFSGMYCTHSRYCNWPVLFFLICYHKLYSSTVVSKYCTSPRTLHMEQITPDFHIG